MWKRSVSPGEASCLSRLRVRCSSCRYRCGFAASDQKAIHLVYRFRLAFDRQVAEQNGSVFVPQIAVPQDWHLEGLVTRGILTVGAATQGTESASG